MLIPDSIHPENSLYYLGSVVINELQKEEKQNLVGLFSKVKGEVDISFPLLLLTIDWLYLVGIIELSEEGKVKLCL